LGMSEVFLRHADSHPGLTRPRVACTPTPPSCKCLQGFNPPPPSLPCRRCRFYDETKVGDVSSRLSADCQKVGDQVELNVNVALRSVIQVPRRRWRALQLCISLATYE